MCRVPTQLPLNSPAREKPVLEDEPQLGVATLEWQDALADSCWVWWQTVPRSRWSTTGSLFFKSLSGNVHSHPQRPGGWWGQLYSCVFLWDPNTYMISFHWGFPNRSSGGFALAFLQHALWEWTVKWYEVVRLSKEGTWWPSSTRQELHPKEMFSCESILEMPLSPAHCDGQFLQFAWPGKCPPLHFKCIMAGYRYSIWSRLKSSLLYISPGTDAWLNSANGLCSRLLLEEYWGSSIQRRWFFTVTSTTTCSSPERWIAMPPFLQEWLAEQVQPAWVHVHSACSGISFHWRNRLETDWGDHRFKRQAIPSLCLMRKSL